MIISDLETPALLIEKSKLERNIENMQLLADKRGVKLRPHTKTHKIPELAKLQIANGAEGIAVAKLSEAEIMADAGIEDIQIANIIVGQSKVKRLYKLHERVKSLSCNVDSAEAVEAIAAEFDKNDKWLDVYIEINSGHNRSGLNSYKDIYKLASYIQNSSGVNLIGLFTHAGHAYAADSHEQIEEIGRYEGEFLIEIAGQLLNDRIYITNISVGSTPTAPYCSKVEGVTEIRPGNYVFYDMIQVGLGSCKVDDCALTVLATVISIPDKNRVIIDAGSKALNTDRGASKTLAPEGYGYVIGKNCVIERLSEEHGIISHNGEDFRIGEKLRIIPNHACVVTNLFDFAYLVDGDEITDRYEIKARGKSQ
jgi:D-serine deaminase-like pyridoxal phosphate-dependent protein